MDSMASEDQLFDTPPAVAHPSLSSPGAVVAVDKTFRVYDQDQSFLMPPSLRDWLPDDHLALFVSELVEEVLDLTPFLASYTEARGFPPYHPRLMLKVLLYGYTTGVRSSRKIETRCHDDVAFRYLAGERCPGFPVHRPFPPPAPGRVGGTVFAGLGTVSAGSTFALMRLCRPRPGGGC
jgi:hypothetical protein